LRQVPESIKKKKTDYQKLSSEIHNYLTYIKLGNFSKAASQVLKEGEGKCETTPKIPER